jgi:hypothetical protein
VDGSSLAMVLLGAPETDRTRHRNATITGVSQTIDTWSFGCVLSVSATWVILGYQGVLAYEKVRQAAIKILRDRKLSDETVDTPTADDCFHDGRKILPEIIQWHEYLRGTIRKSDCTTFEVLQLVEDSMLVEKPGGRMQSPELCQRLSELLRVAKARYGSLVEFNPLYAASNILKTAFHDVQLQAHRESDRAASEAPTTRLNTGSRTDGRSLALPHQGSNHQSTRISKADRMPKGLQAPAVRGKDIRSKPIQSGLSIIGESARPTTPTYGKAHLHESPPGILPDEATWVDKALHDTSHATQKPQLILNDEHGMERPVLQGSPQVDPITSLERWPSSDHPHVWKQPQEPRNVLPKSMNLEEIMQPNSQTFKAQGSGDPQTPEGSYGQDSDDNNPFYILANHNSHPPNRSSPEVHEQPPPPSPNLQHRPAHFIIDSKWEVCAELHSIQNAPRGLRSLFRAPKADKVLEMFLNNRNIMFLVDDGLTMDPYWRAMRMVLEVLSTKIGKLDEDGLDLKFAISRRKVNNAKKDTLLACFDQASAEAQSRAREHAGRGLKQPEINSQTNMNITLSHIFNDYLKDSSKAMTLIVLTDGIWEGSPNQDERDKMIVDLLNHPKIKQRVGRWFTIEFVSFGEAGLATLNRLDNDLIRLYGIK